MVIKDISARLGIPLALEKVEGPSDNLRGLYWTRRAGRHVCRMTSYNGSASKLVPGYLEKGH